MPQNYNTPLRLYAPSNLNVIIKVIFSFEKYTCMCSSNGVIKNV